MAPRLPVYGLDIETDTTADGLDPDVARVLAVAVADADGTSVFCNDDEAVLLRRLDAHLAALPTGVIATWFGSQFDLPFLHRRAQLRSVSLGLGLWRDPRRPSRPCDGPDGVWAAGWGGHGHLDAYRLWEHVRTALGVSASLKSVAGLLHLDHVVLEDASATHRLGRSRLCAYVASDARLTRRLALLGWDRARLALDPPRSLAISA